MNEQMTPISIREIINAVGMGHFEGPFTFVCNGNKPNYRGRDWDGKAGDIVVAEAIEIGHSNSTVYIGGMGYNSACFV